MRVSAPRFQRSRAHDPWSEAGQKGSNEEKKKRGTSLFLLHIFPLLLVCVHSCPCLSFRISKASIEKGRKERERETKRQTQREK